jgi:hypothetical protein
VGRLLLQHVSLVQPVASAPVLWLHEHSQLSVQHVRIVGQGARLCVGSHGALTLDNVDFRQWTSSDGAHEGGDNVCIFLQAGGTLRCGDGNVFAHHSDGERVSRQRPAVLATSPNCLWPHPGTEFVSYIELERLAHYWTWPLPSLATRMPPGFLRDGQPAPGRLWPQRWHAIEAARGGARPQNAMGLVLACIQPGDELLLGSGIFELPERYWCSIGAIRGAGTSRTIVRLPLSSCVHVTHDADVRLQDLTLQVRSEGPWFWVFGRLRLRSTSLQRLGSGGGNRGGRVCVSSGGELRWEGDNSWEQWAGSGSGGGHLVACQPGTQNRPGGKVAGEGYGNVFSREGGAGAFACEVGTGRSMELCWLVEGLEWPAEPPSLLAEAAPPIPNEDQEDDSPTNAEDHAESSSQRCYYVETSSDQVDPASEAAAAEAAVEQFLSGGAKPNETEPEPEPETGPEMIMAPQEEPQSSGPQSDADAEEGEGTSTTVDSESGAVTITDDGDGALPELSPASGTTAVLPVASWSNCEVALSSALFGDRVVFGAGIFRLPRNWAASCLSGLAELRGDGIDQTIVYLPPGGVWFGPAFASEGRPSRQQYLERQQLTFGGVGPGPGAARPGGVPTKKTVRLLLPVGCVSMLPPRCARRRCAPGHARHALGAG